MAYEITVPRLGWSMEEGVFVRWLKREGDTVRPGEMLFELEGEKALQEIEAVDGGILRIFPDAPEPGSTVRVGQVLGYLAAAGEAIDALAIPGTPPRFSTKHADSRIVENRNQPATGEEVALARSGAGGGAQPVLASPRARRVARELNVDLKQLAGSGAGGRVRERDVRAAAGASSTKRIPISKRRRTIAERMITSREQTVPVTLTTRADATKLVMLRERLKRADLERRPSYQDCLLPLVAQTLARHPLLAARWSEESYSLPSAEEIHIGIAVDTDEGLLVPVIRGAYGRSIVGTAAESRRLIDRARSGHLGAADLQGGVFTITNLGSFGIDAFTPVINWPEVAILGLGAIREQPFPSASEIKFRLEITLSLTFDHRRIDGAPAARFLQDLVVAIDGITVD